MPQDNTLGAPTEGLGQSVTFKVSDSGGIPQLQAQRLAPARGELRGGNIRNSGTQIALQDAREGGQILEALGKLGGAMIQPRIDEARKVAFMDGVRQVAAGTAVKEIVDEQPWYSSMFGPTPVVEGARTYASFSKVQEEASAIEQAMPELRKQSPKEFQAYLSKRMSSMATGDAGTDTLATQAFIKELPGLMKGHAKEHIGWQQGLFAEQTRAYQSGAAARFTAAASRYNPAAKQEDLLVKGYETGSFTDANDVLEAKIKFAQAFEPVAGIPAETHAKMTTAVVSDLLSQRNLRAYYALVDSGAVSDNRIGPDNSKRLREQADRAESRARAEMPQQLVDAYAAIKTMPSLYDEVGINEKLKNSIDVLNAAHMQYTGGREPLIQGTTAGEIRASLMTNQQEALRRAQRADEAARDKLLGQQEKAAAKQQAVNEAVGLLRGGHNLTNVSSDTEGQAWNVLRADSQHITEAAKSKQPVPSALAKARVAGFHRSSIDKEGQGSIRQTAQAVLDANDADGFEALYQNEYAPLVQAAGGEFAAKAYFGEFADKFSRYHMFRKNAKDANQFVAAYTVARSDNQPLSTAKESLDVKGQAELADSLDGWLGFGQQMEPRFASGLWKSIKPFVEHRPGSLGDNIKAAIAAKKEQGLEFTGKFFWQGDKANAFQSRVNDISLTRDAKHPITQDNFGKVFNSTVDAIVTKQGLSADSLQTVFTNGRDGMAVNLMGLGQDGQWVMYSITPAMVQDHAESERKTEKERIARKPLIFSN